MIMDDQTKLDIETLLTKAMPKLIEADRGGDSDLFLAVGVKYGPLAHRVYLALDMPERSYERYHDKATKRVLLDPWTILNRAKSFQDTEITIDDQEFWMHGDMIKTLCDYIDLCRNSVTALIESISET